MPKKISSKPVVAAVKKFKPAANKLRQLAKTGFSDVFNDIFGALSSSVARNGMAIIVALTAAVIILDKENKFIAAFLEKHLDEKTATFLKDHIFKIYGFLIFVPTVFAVPAKSQLACALAAAGVLVLLDTHSPYLYSAQSLLLVIFFRVRLLQAKILAVGVVGIAWALGYKLLHLKAAPYLNFASNATVKSMPHGG